MLARIYHNPQNKEENQSRLQKILQFWASKEVFDQDTIYGLEGDMIGGVPSSSFPGPSKEQTMASKDSASGNLSPKSDFFECLIKLCSLLEMH